MAGVLGPNSRYPQSTPPIWPLANEDLPVFTLDRLVKVFEITSQRLLDQSQAGVYMGKTPHTPPFCPFWAYSRTLPQGVELLV